MVLRQTRIFLFSIFFSLVLLGLLAVPVEAQQNETGESSRLTLSTAPINPAFEEWQNQRFVLFATDNDYPLGYVPPPLERYREVDHNAPPGTPSGDGSLFDIGLKLAIGIIKPDYKVIKLSQPLITATKQLTYGPEKHAPSRVLLAPGVLNSNISDELSKHLIANRII